MHRLMLVALLGLCLAGCVQGVAPNGHPVGARTTANDGGGGGGGGGGY